MIRLYSYNSKSKPGVRTLEQIRIRGNIFVLRVEITDEEGDKTILWEATCDDCDFFENGLTETEALEDARAHTCDG